MAKYKRILLKLSGESLMGNQKYGIDETRLNEYALQIADLAVTGVQTAIVIGGGNIFRGLSGSSKGYDRVKGDQMGMLATVINSLALGSALNSLGKKATESLSKGEIVIIAGGTGNPYFTTDTAGALRAIETRADIMLKGTRVDGIYSADPEKDPAAERFEKISFEEVYAKNLKIMDLTATTLCKENSLPVLVFNMDVKGNLQKVIAGENIGTMVF